MKRFSELFWEIDGSNSAAAKVDAMVQYFRTAPPEDVAWVISLSIGRRPKIRISNSRLQVLATEFAGIPPWLFGECFEAVGDLAETISLILPDCDASTCGSCPLSWWMTERILPLSQLPEAAQAQSIVASWSELGRKERFLFNKLILGSLKVNISHAELVEALAEWSGLAESVIAHRLAGNWSPSVGFIENVIASESRDDALVRPYRFCSSDSMDVHVSSLGPVGDWQVEWRWHGVRTQLIRRGGKSFVWSSGGEFLNERLPELLEICHGLPEGTVLDGEAVAWEGDMPLDAVHLQKRLDLKSPTKKVLDDIPVVLIAFDILEHDGIDVRGNPLSERRDMLGRVFESIKSDRNPLKPLRSIRHSGVVSNGSDLLLSACLWPSDWD